MDRASYANTRTVTPLRESTCAPASLGCQVIVPLHRALDAPHTTLLKHNLSKLRRWPTTLIGPHSKRKMLNDTRERLEQDTGTRIAVKYFADQFFRDRPSYSALLMSKGFYSAFAEHSHILICQPDAIILSDRLSEWIETDYSFVGAPHFKGYQSPVRPLEFLSSLNGGLSLRHVGDAQRALRNIVLLRSKALALSPQATSTFRCINRIMPHLRLVAVAPKLNEDIFWTEIVPKVMPEFRIPSPSVALKFAFEACPEELYEIAGCQLPFGGHAIERYSLRFWHRHLPPSVAAALESMDDQETIPQKYDKTTQT